MNAAFDYAPVELDETFGTQLGFCPRCRSPRDVWEDECSVCGFTDAAASAPVAILHSRGRTKFDNCPEQLVAESFDAFEQAVLADRAPRKGLTYIAAAFRRGLHDYPSKFPGEAHWRLKNLVLPRAFIAHDLDWISDRETLAELEVHLTHFRCFLYETASSTHERPRCRVIYATDRPMDRDECERVSDALMRRIEGAVGAGLLKFDRSVHRPEQPIYGPTVGARVATFHGEVVKVDDLLADPVSDPETDDRQSGEVRSSQHEQWLTDLLTGDNLNGNALRLTGRLIAKGLDAAMVRAVMLTFRNDIAAVRGETRARELFEGGEIDRMIAGAVAKFSPPPEADISALLPPVMGTAGDSVTTPVAGDSDVVGALLGNLVGLDTVGSDEWFLPHVVTPWIPQDEVTLLAGHGGGGKSYVALNVGVHVCLGRPFGSLQTEQTNVLFFSGEDGAPVLRQRLGRICRVLDIDPQELEGRLHLLDASDTDPALHREQRITRDGRQYVVTETPLVSALAALVEKLNVGLVVIDNASDTFDDDEIRRARVRAFIRSLRSRIARPGRAVLLLAHINKVSANGGRAAGSEDYSGSTAWHNSVRSRLSLIPDGDNAVKIEHLKANLGTKAEPVRLEWHEGVPVVAGTYHNAGAEAAAALIRVAERERDETDKQTLVSIVADFDKRGERVTTSMQGGYTVFKSLKSHRDFPAHTSSDRLARLLRDLETEGRIFRCTKRTNDRKWKEVFTTVPSAPNPLTNDGEGATDDDGVRQ